MNAWNPCRAPAFAPAAVPTESPGLFSGKIPAGPPDIGPLPQNLIAYVGVPLGIGARLIAGDKEPFTWSAENLPASWAGEWTLNPTTGTSTTFTLTATSGTLAGSGTLRCTDNDLAFDTEIFTVTAVYDVPAQIIDLAAQLQVEGEEYTCRLDWTPSTPEAVTQTIQRRFNGGAWSDLITLQGNMLSHVDGPLVDGLYEYRIRPTNPAGEPAWSNIAPCLVGPPASDSPRIEVPPTLFLPVNQAMTPYTVGKVQGGAGTFAMVELGSTPGGNLAIDTNSGELTGTPTSIGAKFYEITFTETATGAKDRSIFGIFVYDAIVSLDGTLAGAYAGDGSPGNPWKVANAFNPGTAGTVYDLAGNFRFDESAFSWSTSAGLRNVGGHKVQYDAYVIDNSENQFTNPDFTNGLTGWVVPQGGEVLQGWTRERTAWLDTTNGGTDTDRWALRINIPAGQTYSFSADTANEVTIASGQDYAFYFWGDDGALTGETSAISIKCTIGTQDSDATGTINFRPERPGTGWGWEFTSTQAGTFAPVWEFTNGGSVTQTVVISHCSFSRTGVNGVAGGTGQIFPCIDGLILEQIGNSLGRAFAIGGRQILTKNDITWNAPVAEIGGHVIRTGGDGYHIAGNTSRMGSGARLLKHRDQWSDIINQQSIGGARDGPLSVCDNTIEGELLGTHGDTILTATDWAPLVKGNTVNAGITNGHYTNDFSFKFPRHLTLKGQFAFNVVNKGSASGGGGRGVRVVQNTDWHDNQITTWDPQRNLEYGNGINSTSAGGSYALQVEEIPINVDGWNNTLTLDGDYGAVVRANGAAGAADAWRLRDSTITVAAGSQVLSTPGAALFKWGGGSLDLNNFQFQNLTMSSDRYFCEYENTISGTHHIEGASTLTLVNSGNYPGNPTNSPISGTLLFDNSTVWDDAFTESEMTTAILGDPGITGPTKPQSISPTSWTVPDQQAGPFKLDGNPLVTVGGVLPLTYSVPVQPVEGVLFEIQNDDELWLQAGSTADIADVDYDLTVRVTDANGDTRDEPMTVTVGSVGGVAVIKLDDDYQASSIDLSLTIPNDGSVSAGDELYIFVSSGVGNTRFANIPTGWTESFRVLGGDEPAGGNTNAQIFHREAQAGDLGTTVTVSAAIGGTTMQGSLVSAAGANHATFNSDYIATADNAQPKVCPDVAVPSNGAAVFRYIDSAQNSAFNHSSGTLITLTSADPSVGAYAHGLWWENMDTGQTGTEEITNLPTWHAGGFNAVTVVLES